MTKRNEGKYEVECLRCGKRFTVTGITGDIPEHPRDNELIEPYRSFVPCAGSKMPGRPIRPVI